MPDSPADPGRIGLIRVLSSAELTPSQLSRVAGMYRGAFPPELRVPFAELSADGPDDLLLVAVHDTEPVGFAAMMRLGQANWTFLRYYGVVSRRRREGIGLAFWRLLQPVQAAAGWPARIAFEIEHPGGAGIGPAERLVRDNRLAFWLRCGARLLPVGGYVMPDIAGLAEPEPMLLMAHGPTDLTAGEIAQLVTALYTGRYGLRSNHPLVAAALESIGSQA